MFNLAKYKLVNKLSEHVFFFKFQLERKLDEQYGRQNVRVLPLCNERIYSWPCMLLNVWDF